jgi:mitochondrial fission protein ELM1
MKLNQEKIIQTEQITEIQTLKKLIHIKEKVKKTLRETNRVAEIILKILKRKKIT